MQKTKVGGRGDPRMKKSVSVKLINPNLSLLDALLIGGFRFNRNPEMIGHSDSTTYDSDNIMMRQRKNQLNRRMRTIVKHHERARTNQEAGCQSRKNAEERKKQRILIYAKKGSPSGVQVLPIVALLSSVTII